MDTAAAAALAADTAAPATSLPAHDPHADADVLIAHVPVSGDSIGNGSLRAVLAWDVLRYDAARDVALATRKVEKGRGRGGSLRRTEHGIATGGTAPAAPATAVPAQTAADEPESAHDLASEVRTLKQLLARRDEAERAVQKQLDRIAARFPEVAAMGADAPAAAPLAAASAG